MYVTSIVCFCLHSEWGEGPYTAGIICIVIASLMIVAGIITAIFTCVCVGRATEGAVSFLSEYCIQGLLV